MSIRADVGYLRWSPLVKKHVRPSLLALVELEAALGVLGFGPGGPADAAVGINHLIHFMHYSDAVTNPQYEQK
jgi:hypothetical protein